VLALSRIHFFFLGGGYWVLPHFLCKTPAKNNIKSTDIESVLLTFQINVCYSLTDTIIYQLLKANLLITVGNILVYLKNH